MNARPGPDADHWAQALQPVFRGEHFLIVAESSAGAARLAEQFLDLGAARPFVLAATRGIGPEPDPERMEHRALGIEAADVVESLRLFEAALADVPEAVRCDIERWDPERRASCLAVFTMGDVAEVAGRPRYAHRPPAWARFEDKTQLPAFFDAIDVRRGPLAVVPAQASRLQAAAQMLDEGLGTVWAGDAREGLNGGGSHVRWVRCTHTAEQACGFFEEHCDRVRIMPFLEGVPCSVHGLVLDRDVAVFRPLEMLSLLREDDARLHYVGTASFWDPDDAAREQMREVARRVGEGLRDRVAYRGAYTVDGVLTSDGFRPTEVNTRIGSALNELYGGSGGPPLHALALAAAAGEPVQWRAADLEDLVLSRADARRGGWMRARVAGRPEQARTWKVVRAGEGLRVAAENQDNDGLLGVAPLADGGFVSWVPKPDRVRRDVPFARECVQALRLAESLSPIHAGPLRAAG